MIIIAAFILLMTAYVFTFPRFKAEQVMASFFSFVYAPVSEGDVIGRIDCVLDGEVLRSIPLTAVQDVKARKVKKSFIKKIKEFFTYG